MQREIDPRLAITALALVVVILGAFAWRHFASPSGTLTAAQAGLGRHMQPGEIPGARGPVNAPAVVPSANH